MFGANVNNQYKPTSCVADIPTTGFVPKIPSTGFGSNMQPSTGFGSNIQPSTGFGSNIQPSTGFVPNMQPSTGFGSNTLPATGFVHNIQPSTGFVPNIQPSSCFGPKIQPTTGFVPNRQPSMSCNHLPSECCKQRPVEIHHHHYYYYCPQGNCFPNLPNFSQPHSVYHKPLSCPPPPPPPPVKCPSPPVCFPPFKCFPPVPESSAPHSRHINIVWKDMTVSDDVPPDAVKGGTDVNGEPIYVGRAFHKGDWLPAKIIPGKKCCVSYNCKEHLKTSFQILCDPRARWVSASGGKVPRNAVDGGVTSCGEKLYIGRVDHNGTKTVGKIHPSHGVCYIPFNGEEINYPNYEVLISDWLTRPFICGTFLMNDEQNDEKEIETETGEQNNEKETENDTVEEDDEKEENFDYITWEEAKDYEMPPGAVKGGTDIDGEPSYVGRAFHEGDWMPATIMPRKQYCSISYGGSEHQKTSFQVLCAPHAVWIPQFNGKVPSEAIEGGKTAYGETLYIGRVVHKNLKTIGKVHPSYGLCYIPFNGKELGYPDYEVLASGSQNNPRVPAHFRRCWKY